MNTALLLLGMALLGQAGAAEAPQAAGPADPSVGAVPDPSELNVPDPAELNAPNRRGSKTPNSEAEILGNIYSAGVKSGYGAAPRSYGSGNHYHRGGWGLHHGHHWSPSARPATSTLPAEIVLLGPDDKGAKISYMLNGRWSYTIASGKKQRLDGKRAWTVTYLPRPGAKPVTVALSAGETYTFKQSDGGWNLLIDVPPPPPESPANPPAISVPDPAELDKP